MSVTIEKNASPATDGHYTSVIVDASGFAVERDHSPKVLSADGTAVYGTQAVDPDYVDEHGIAVYAGSVEDAKQYEVAGKNPLVVKASQQAESRFNVVIGVEDATKLIAANRVGHFLERFRVIIVIDRTAKAARRSVNAGDAAAKPHESSPDGADYTSVIIDASDFVVERDHSPKLYSEDGTAVYGTQEVDPDYVDENGIAHYAYSLEEARQDEMAGKNPLVLKASKQAGSKFNVVIGVEDATKLIAANKIGHFLEKFRVIIVTARPKR